MPNLSPKIICDHYNNSYILYSTTTSIYLLDQQKRGNTTCVSLIADGEVTSYLYSVIVTGPYKAFSYQEAASAKANGHTRCRTSVSE